MMKKTILAVLTAAAFTVLPAFGLASDNSFLSLVQQATSPNTGPCGLPTDPGFCACFTTAIVDGCEHQHIHPKCEPKAIKEYIDKLFGDNYEVVCKRFPPQGIPNAECVADLQHWHDSCPVQL